MSKTKRSIIICVIVTLVLMLGFSVKSEAVTTKKWTDEITGIEFNITLNDDGTTTAEPLNITPGQANLALVEAQKRALEEAKKLNDNTGSSTDKEEVKEEEKEEEQQKPEQEEEKVELKKEQTSKETVTKIIPEIRKTINDIKDKGDLAWGSNAYCINQAGAIAESARNNIINVAGNIIDIANVTAQGLVVGQGYSPRFGTVKATNASGIHDSVFGFVKADPIVTSKSGIQRLGEDYKSAAIAYIYSRVNDKKDNSNALDNPIQGAIWAENYYGYGQGYSVQASKPLSQEADNYQAYRKAVEEFKRVNNGLVVKDTVVNKTVSTDINKKEQILGPYKVDYVRGYSKVAGREFVEFGGLTGMKLYNQDEKEIPNEAWEIVFNSNRKIDENDKAYLEKFPARNEEFYVKLYIDKLPKGTNKISKIVYEYKETCIVANAETYKRKVTSVLNWEWQSSMVSRIPLPTGGMRPVFEYRLVPRLVRVNAQETTILYDVEIIEKVYDYSTPAVPPTYQLVPFWPYWPYWPSYPDYPDYPETDLTFTIAGIVWEDLKTGKESNFDGVIGVDNDKNAEQGMPNVEVKLYEHGTSNVIKTTYTSDTGRYVFNEVPIGTYDVGFVYDGMTYRATQSFAGGDVTDYKSNPNDEKYLYNSKVDESVTDRQNFNNKFYEITAEGAKNSAGIKTNTEPLEYKTENGVSKIQTTYADGKVKKDFQFEAKTVTGLGIGYPLSKYINNADGDKTINGQTYFENYPYMTYVNLGLQKREEVDFALMKDVSTATVTVNGKEINYKYNSRASQENVSSAFDIAAKKVASYSDIKYNREVYKSDYNYRIDDYKTNNLNPVTATELRGLKEEDQEMKVFITYKVRLRNQSVIYSGTINQLVDYYDASYTLISEDKKLDIRNDDGTIVRDKVVAKAPYYITQSGIEGSLKVTTPEDYNSSYKKTYISGIENQILQSGEYIDLYITFEVNKDNKRAVELGEKSNEVEITSYSTFDQGAVTKTKTMGMIDRDSAPGNLNPEDSNTLEDDSDIAPTITVKLYEEEIRTMNGVVWKDERTNILATGQVVGDGLRQDHEKRINGVLVQLIEIITTDTGAQYEYIWQEMYTGENGYKYVDMKDGNIYDASIGKQNGGVVETERGEYKFSGYIPGDYIVRFIYGKDEKTILTGTNDTSYNGHDYKSTAYWQGNNIHAEWYDLSSSYLNNTPLSDAKDNEARRLKVIDYSDTMINSVAQVLASHELGTENYNTLLHEALKTNTYMYADTAKMKVEVEYDVTNPSGVVENNTYNIRDIDFGIEERPTASIELEKEIVSMKVTLSDGTTLVDTEAGIKQNVQFAPTAISIYMDDEVMQGANVQIRYRIIVKNNSQIDYTGATSSSVGTTYYTGKVSATDRLVTTSIDMVADYVDNSLVYRVDDNQGGGWESMEQTRLGSIEQMEAQGYLDRDVKLAEKDIHQILINETLTRTQLAPGETKTLDLVLTKTISAADDTDDLSYTNIAEILQYTNLVGRRADLPGNQDPTKTPTEADADRTETIVILPPFGANKAIASYIAIAIAVLAVVAGGVIVVKKKLLNK